MLSSSAHTSLTTPLRRENYAMLLLRQDAKTVRDQTANHRQLLLPASLALPA